ncbi:hypothetical protein [Streptomyces sp. NPDC045470]|uniref:hypothetical protein n=1 Tax=Streptomyces sp. NPDC045470 TaxID=3155469 RepID=UPI00340883F6
MSAHAAPSRWRPRELGAVCAGVLWATAHATALGLLADIVTRDLDQQHGQEPVAAAADTMPDSP